MKKHFFSHLIAIENLETEIDTFDIEDNEKIALKNLVHESIYHSVLDAILSEMDDEDKKVFLSHLVSEDHDKVWSFVNKKVLFIEDKIKKAAEDIKEEIHKDVKDTKKKHQEEK